MSELCECGSMLKATVCCLPYLLGESTPKTAEALMRSRYTAFATGNEEYLLKTWMGQDKPKSIEFDQRRWIGLKILSTRLGTEHDNEGWVNFVARYKVNGRAYKLEEHSHFVFQDGRWFYDRADQLNQS